MRPLPTVSLVVALLTLSAVAVPAPLDPSEVVKVMASRRLAIRRLCWESLPSPRPDALVKVEITIGSVGVVVAARAVDPKAPDAVTKCILTEVKKTTFSESDSGGTFAWPFLMRDPDVKPTSG